MEIYGWISLVVAKASAPCGWECTFFDALSVQYPVLPYPVLLGTGTWRLRKDRTKPRVHPRGRRTNPKKKRKKKKKALQPVPSISMVDSVTCLRYAECSRAPGYIIRDTVARHRLLAAHGARSCVSVRTQPTTATGAPSQTSTMLGRCVCNIADCRRQTILTCW